MSDHTAPEIAVVGAGPAGLMAAEVLAGAGRQVTVYDRMPSVGRKFLMAGRGGLNLTHTEPLEQFFSRYGPAEEHLKAAVEAFPPERLRAWCEGLGQETFVGSSGRVFPRAFKASPLLRAWLARLDGLSVRLALRRTWTGWSEAGDLLFTGPGSEATAVRPRLATVLALGGASWPRLGSDGAWVGPLTEAGHRVSPLRPANAGFAVAWSPVFRDRFEGAPLKRVALSFRGAAARGEALVTRDGIEGGAVYALSGPLRDAVLAEGRADLRVDLRPDVPAEALTRRLGAPRGGQSTANWLRKAAGLPPVGIGLLREATGGGALPLDPAVLARLIKAAPVTLTGVNGLERAISTAGGLSFADLDARLMLRGRPGTFAAGEMLDWEAPTGGYLLQASFATGVAAAHGVLDWLEAAGGTR